MNESRETLNSMVEDMKGNEAPASQEKPQTQETPEQQQSVR